MAKRKYPLGATKCGESAWFYQTPRGVEVYVKTDIVGYGSVTATAVIKWRDLAPAVANHQRKVRP